MLHASPNTIVGTTTFTATGMTCSHCERAVIEEVSRIDGIETVGVDLSSGSITVTTAIPIDRAEIVAAVDEAGYSVVEF